MKLATDDGCGGVADERRGALRGSAAESPCRAGQEQGPDAQLPRNWRVREAASPARHVGSGTEV